MFTKLTHLASKAMNAVVNDVSKAETRFLQGHFIELNELNPLLSLVKAITMSKSNGYGCVGESSAEATLIT